MVLLFSVKLYVCSLPQQTMAEFCASQWNLDLVFISPHMTVLSFQESVWQIFIAFLLWLVYIFLGKKTKIAPLQQVWSHRCVSTSSSCILPKDSGHKIIIMAFWLFGNLDSLTLISSHPFPCSLVSILPFPLTRPLMSTLWCHPSPECARILEF